MESRSLMRNYDHNGSGTSEGRPDVERRRLLGCAPGRRWLLWLSDKIKAMSRTPTRFEDGFRDNLLRPHLFGVTVRRKDGLD